jgi:twitching motility two-component system response regulator PilH
MPSVGSKRSVLIVEDDRSLREMYRSALREAGYEVGVVEDGTDALWRIDEWTPDVVVLDLALPRLSGRDFRYELRGRRETRNVPVVIVSGTDTSDLNPNEFAAILHKPITPDALVKAVDDAIRGVRRVHIESASS